MNEPQRYLGKYRGTVLNNIDPQQIGRLLVQVPDVEALLPSSWAMPCLPAAGLAEGYFHVPPIGAGVWVEFEHGDPDYPIWTGCFVGAVSDRPPASMLVPPGVSGFTIGTKLQNTMMVSDLPGPTGGILLKSATGASITVNDTGIYIQNGKGASIVMTGPTVTVNQGALVVT